MHFIERWLLRIISAAAAMPFLKIQAIISVATKYRNALLNPHSRAKSKFANKTDIQCMQGLITMQATR